jgi:hypothetical protein
VLKTAERLVALPFTVDVTAFQMGASSIKFSATAVGRSPMDPAGKPLKVAPMTLVFEFLDTGGTVIEAKEVTVPGLAENVKHEIQLDAKGAGIVGWRYHVKPA